MTSFSVRSADGTLIRAHRAGSGPHRWLLPPAMGTPLLCWKHIFEAFADRMCIVTWDQRGTHGSTTPRGPRGFAFDRHVEDGLAVLERLGWQGRFVTGSWSMGVQIGLAIFDRMPARVAALVLINGSFDHVLSHLGGPPQTPAVARALLRGIVRAAPLLRSISDPLLRGGWVGRAMDGLRISRGNRDFVVAITKALEGIDLASYFQILLDLDQHSASAVLPRVDVPALVVAGACDLATPPAVMRELHQRIAQSEYVEIAEGTHYLPLEQPAELNRVLERFFGARVFVDTWGPPARDATRAPSTASPRR